MAERSSSSASRRPRQRNEDSLGQWAFEADIGKGSFAKVYRGRQKANGAVVAIKAVELARLSQKLKENLYSEIKILKSLRHPHIVALHDCVESPTHINLIMELCELGDMSVFIKKRERLITDPMTHDLARKYPNAPNCGLNEVVTRHFLKQLSSALKFLREGNFVHRDVKPQNLLLLPSPQFRESNKSTRQILSGSEVSLIPAVGLTSLPMLKLADFGFARVLPSTSLADTLCGSPLYMAPEILRYERYDAKADLWSVGTVLYEMVTGRPPFRASNHVELLRKIENAQDVIKFPREAIVSSEVKGLIRGLLKGNSVERMSFDDFFSHPVIVNQIPGLVEDDIPKQERRVSREFRFATKSDEPSPPLRKQSFRRYPATEHDGREGGPPLSPRLRRSSPLATPIETKPNPFEQAQPARLSYSPRNETTEGLEVRRPVVQASSSAPTRPPAYVERRRGLSNAYAKAPGQDRPSAHTLASDNTSLTRVKARGGRALAEERERAAQDMAFERDYVVVEKKHVEVNALADQFAMWTQPQSVKAGQIVRRATQQGVPILNTGVVPNPPSRNFQIAQSNQFRKGSYDKSLSGSPGSVNPVYKAIHDASMRLFGVKYPPQLLGKGHSPPQIYHPFPVYPTPSAPLTFLGDDKLGGPLDEDTRAAQRIEDYATRSDVVYGFAEVKLKQLVPLAPSMDYGLGGISADQWMAEENDGLTVEAIVSLSEEALLLYIKALSLLEKSMAIAALWWSRKTRPAVINASALTNRDPISMQKLEARVVAVVQWIRDRFNVTLEKANLMKQKLVDAQQKLPEDHLSHPMNHTGDAASNSASADGVFVTAGISAEKLMYDRALEMSRAAAINEIANEDLPGCELSYMTAIRMLEAVLDNSDDLTKHKITSSKDEQGSAREENAVEINSDDQQSVQKLTQMITGRLAAVRKKMQMIASAQQQQNQQQQTTARRRSGDITPRSIPAS